MPSSSLFATLTLRAPNTEWLTTSLETSGIDLVACLDAAITFRHADNTDYSRSRAIQSKGSLQSMGAAGEALGINFF
jgi:hypothetical protein